MNDLIDAGVVKQGTHGLGHPSMMSSTGIGLVGWPETVDFAVLFKFKKLWANGPAQVERVGLPGPG